VQLTVRISRKADAALRAQADQAGVPLGKLIERLIEKN
jgi:predicted HicB family RNase H-like nuclease